MSREIDSPDHDRRAFVAGGGKLAIAATAAAGAAHLAVSAAPAAPPAPQAKREIIGGSPSPSYSRATRLGQLVFVAGCVGMVETDGKNVMPGDFKSQAKAALLHLKASVEASGSSLDKVLKCTCFLKEYADFKIFNETYRQIIPAPRPARSTVVVKDFVVPGALLEIDCVCHV